MSNSNLVAHAPNDAKSRTFAARRLNAFPARNLLTLVVICATVLVPTITQAANLYVSYTNKDSVHSFAPTGADLGAFAITPPFTFPGGLAFDTSGNLYLGSSDSRISKFGPTGTKLGTFASTGLNAPGGLVFDSSGNLYTTIAAGIDRIQKFGPTGADLGTFAITGISTSPTGLAFDSSGNLFVAYASANTIHKFGPTGTDLGTFATLGLVTNRLERHMKPFLTSDWCGLAWTAFVPFEAALAERRIYPVVGGFYRVRIVGQDRLAYIGQTGRNLRERIASLAGGTLSDDMPFNDPHTAAPKLWSFARAEALRYEASVAACDLSKSDRMGLECFLVWQYRKEAGVSPLCNFGRLHRRYVTSKQRSTGMRGRRLDDVESDIVTGPSLAALGLHGAIDACDWMSLPWTTWQPLTAAGLVGVANGPGLYRITDNPGRILYIGQSAALQRRLRDHARAWQDPVQYSVVTSEGSTPTQLLELENDLIGAYFEATHHSPARQFGRPGQSPPAE